MNVSNVTDRKKLKVRFALFYITSIILLALIFFVIGSRFGESVYVASTTEIKPSLQDNTVLKQDELLRSKLKNLQQMDFKYSKLSGDSSNKHLLESLNEDIIKEEDAFSKTMDSVGNEKKKLENASDKIFLDSIISSFRYTLNNRRSMGFLRTALLSDNKISPDQRKFLQLQMDLTGKNEKISLLENQIKNNKQDSETGASGSLQKAMQQVKDLQTQLESEKQQMAALVSQNSDLTNNNSHLTTQVNDLKKNSVEGQQKSSESYSDITNKMDNLNAKLAFAEIDCDLIRADARQTVSNARQRKDLLENALNSLKNLAQSKNPSVQQKAKEKMVQLQNIASAAHD